MLTPWMIERCRFLAPALVAVAAAGALPALAQESPPAGPPAPVDEAPPFAVQPSGPNGPGGRDYFIYDLAPGEVFGDTVAVSNLGDEPIRFVLYATDAFNTSDSAAFTLLREEEEPTDVGSWIQLAAPEYEVPAGQRIDVPFSVSVPRDASPGDHVGAIVAQPVTASPQPGEDELSFDIRFRIGARVYLRVEGPVEPRLRVTQLQLDHEQGIAPTSGSTGIEYVVRNDGNVRLTPTAELRITGPFGITVREFRPRELPELLPGGEVTIAENADGLPLLGRLHAELDVVADGTTARASAATWAVPWALAGPLAVVAALWWWRRRRRRAARGGGRPDTPKPATVDLREPVGAR